MQDLKTKRLDFDITLVKAKAALLRAGLSHRNAIPPMYSIYWRLGIRLKPPHFQSFVGNMMTTGLPFAFAALGVYMMQTGRDRFSPAQAAIVFCVSLFLTGIASATYYEVSRRRSRLPRWRDL